MFTVKSFRVTPEGDTLQNHADLLLYILRKNGMELRTLSQRPVEPPPIRDTEAVIQGLTKALEEWPFEPATIPTVKSSPAPTVEKKKRKRASRAAAPQTPATPEKPAPQTPATPEVPASPASQPTPPPPLPPGAVPPIPTAGAL